MFLTVHAPAGALIGIFAPDPVSAFVLGALSHYVLDAVPHGDEHLEWHLDGAARLRLMIKVGLLDLAVAAAILLLLLQPWRIWPSFAVLAGIAGSVLPDGLQLLHHLFPMNRWLDRHQRAHDFFHLRPIPYDPSFPIGISVQLATLALCAWAVGMYAL